jgi:ribosome modulation factor
MSNKYEARLLKDHKVQKRAYHNGYLAALRGEGCECNPHILTYDILRTKWDEGWLQGMKDVGKQE